MEAINLAGLYQLPLLDWASIEDKLRSGVTQAPDTGRTHSEGTRSVERLGDEFEPGGVTLIQQAAIGRQRGRAAQFGFGQQPQMSFRALAVHILRTCRARMHR
jgi:hypothetical protein